MIRLIVCDDHDLVRTALVRALQAEPDLQVVGEASGPAPLLRLLAPLPTPGTPADVLLLDLSLGEGQVAAGLEVLQRLARTHPALPVLVVSMHDEAGFVAAAQAAGARGYVTKDSPLERLALAIRRVHGGERVFPEGFLAQQPGTSGRWDGALTPREREVMRLICKGRRLSDIGTDLGLSIKTVSTHKVRLMQKLGVSSNAELIKLGLLHGVG